MFTLKGKQLILKFVKFVQSYVKRVWYPPFIGILAALDNFIVVIPNDGILISSAMLTPQRWIRLSFFVALGSTIGAATLAYVIQIYGLQIVEQLFPGLQATSTWTMTHDFFQKYGLWLLFAVAITPFVQQPAIIFSVLASIPVFEIALIVFVGRFIKFLVMSYAGAKAPHLLSKMWGLESELEEAGIKKIE